MTRADALQRLAEATYEALNASEAFADACAVLDDAGLLQPVDIHIRLSGHTTETVDLHTNDADFLRSLHIDPNLEAR